MRVQKIVTVAALLTTVGIAGASSATAAVPTAHATHARTGSHVSAPAAGHAQQLVIAKGRTSTTVHGVTNVDGFQDYQFAARSGQHLTVRLVSSDPHTTWSLVAANGTLLPGSTTLTTPSVTLPGTGAYGLGVHAPAGTTYTLTVSLRG